MKMHKTSRSDRLEQLMRWMMGLALAAAVGWAWMDNVRSADPAARHVGAVVQRS